MYTCTSFPRRKGLIGELLHTQNAVSLEFETKPMNDIGWAAISRQIFKSTTSNSFILEPPIAILQRPIRIFLFPFPFHGISEVIMRWPLVHFQPHLSRSISGFIFNGHVLLCIDFFETIFFSSAYFLSFLFLKHLHHGGPTLTALTMVFCGKPSGSCHSCREKKTRVSKNLVIAPCTALALHSPHCRRSSLWQVDSVTKYPCLRDALNV